MKNIEFKCATEVPQKTAQAVMREGATFKTCIRQCDRYFETKMGRLKLRCNDGVPVAMIGYYRRDEPLIRESEFEYIPLAGDFGSHLADTLSKYLPVVVEVTKQRSQFMAGETIINIDTIDGIGSFVEIEVPAQPGRETDALRAAEGWFKKLELKASHVTPWSYQNLVVMFSRAAEIQTLAKQQGAGGEIILVDGASGVGKTTVVHRMLENRNSALIYARRHTTRAQRPLASDDKEYQFISMNEFRSMADHGHFLEYRDFDFGMSYGIAWTTLYPALMDRKRMIGIMNLGGGWFVKKLLPQAKLILITADNDVVRTRLQARGFMLPEQIEERLANNERAHNIADAYDFVVDTSRQSVESCLAGIERFLVGDADEYS